MLRGPPNVRCPGPSRPKYGPDDTHFVINVNAYFKFFAVKRGRGVLHPKKDKIISEVLPCIYLNIIK